MHAIGACRRARDQDAVFAVVSLMYDRGAPPDAHHCSSALAVCKLSGDVEAAFHWFARMTSAGVAPDAHMLASLAATCSTRIRSLRDSQRRARSSSLGGMQVCPATLVICAAHPSRPPALARPPATS
jgi:pentatricopeptide repeat protein